MFKSGSILRLISDSDHMGMRAAHDWQLYVRQSIRTHTLHI